MKNFHHPGDLDPYPAADALTRLHPRSRRATILRAGAKNLTDKQRVRLTTAIEAAPAHDEVFVAWQCAQQLRSAYHAKSLTEGRRIAEEVVETFHTCPIPEIARLGRTLSRWRPAFLAYFTTSRANNGGTEAVNGIIELHRRLAPRLPQP